MSVYRSFAGFVQFDPSERQVGENTVRNVRIQAVNTDKIVDVTLWDSHDDIVVNKNDFIFVQGKFTTRESGDNTYYNLSASQLIVLAGPVSTTAPAPKAPKAPVHAPKAKVVKPEADLF